jgi:hypothetical protein
MRRKASIILVLAVLVTSLTLLNVSSKAQGQATVRTARPRTVNVSLSGKEPLPSGVAAQIEFGGGGGGGFVDAEPRPHWIQWPTDLAYPGWGGPSGYPFIACGYRSSGAPRPTLILPGGSRVQQVDSQQPEQTCWSYRVPWSFGMELGTYVLILEHENGKLVFPWRIDYPTGMRASVAVSVDEDLFMGFTPGERLTVRYYADGKYVATRLIQIGPDGDALVKVQVARSAPFKIEEVDFTIDSYEFHALPRIMTPREYYKPGERRGLPDPPTRCPGAPPLRLALSTKARIISEGNALNSKPSRPSRDATSLRLDTVPTNGIVDVIEGPICAQNVSWWKVDYKGIVGWTGEGEGSEYWVEPVVQG